MQQRQNKIIFISFSFISLLMIALRDSVVQQVIVLVIGIFILILVNRLLDKEVLKELETKNLEIEKKAKRMKQLEIKQHYRNDSGSLLYKKR